MSFVSVAEHFPDVAATMDDAAVSAEDISAGSSALVWWKCERGHRWKTSVKNRVKGSGCPYCSGHRVLEGFNDLSTTYPDIAATMDDPEFSPNAVSAGSGKKIWWKCERGHRWKIAVCDRVALDSCPYCSGRKVLSGFNDLMTTHPDVGVTMDDDDISPLTVSAGSGKKVWWKCERGHRWKTIIAHRASGSGCPYCAGNKVLAGFNDLTTTHPELAATMDDDDVSPYSVSAGSGKKVWWKCEHGHRWKDSVLHRTQGRGCSSCYNPFSKAESEIADFVESLVLDVIRNDRSLISPKELDIYVPEKHIAIEFNGLWWHSERTGRGRRYHYDKWKACRDRGVQLLTVWEDDWRDRPEIVKSGLAHKLGVDDSAHIGARTCEIVDVSPVDARSFLAAHHIQGSSSGSVRIGLEHDGELVAVMLMKKRSGDEWELVRYATAATVVGGQSRLLHHFESTHSPSSIITFADHEVSNGGLYARTGWVVDGEVPPDYRYVYGGRRQHKFGFRKERFERDPNLLFEPGLTESELAELNGIPRVWDCGKTRWRRR